MSQMSLAEDVSSHNLPSFTSTETLSASLALGPAIASLTGLKSLLPRHSLICGSSFTPCCRKHEMGTCFAFIKPFLLDYQEMIVGIISVAVTGSFLVYAKHMAVNLASSSCCHATPS